MYMFFGTVCTIRKFVVQYSTLQCAINSMIVETTFHMFDIVDIMPLPVLYVILVFYCAHTVQCT